MEKMMRTLLFLIFTLFVFPTIVQAGDYRLGPRDVIDIGVWGFEELQVKSLIVRDDGKIAFPLVGEFEVSGLSPNELSNKISIALEGYINDPKVTVNVTKFRPSRVYVLGEVVRPGLYEMEKQLHLLDAISIAGGYTKDAAKRKVFIIHKNSVDKPIEANLLKLLQKGDMTQNVALADGDVVYLSDNGRIDFFKDIFPLVNAVYYIKDVNKD